MPHRELLLPPQPFLRAILLRSLVIWIGLRGVLFLLFQLVAPSLPAVALIIGIAALLTTMDGGRRNEHIFLGNLGVHVRTLAVLSGIVPLAAELAIRFLA